MVTSNKIKMVTSNKIKMVKSNKVITSYKSVRHTIQLRILWIRGSIKTQLYKHFIYKLPYGMSFICIARNLPEPIFRYPIRDLFFLLMGSSEGLYLEQLSDGFIS